LKGNGWVRLALPDLISVAAAGGTESAGLAIIPCVAGRAASVAGEMMAGMVRSTLGGRLTA
jgi:hypothetical protein